MVAANRATFSVYLAVALAVLTKEVRAEAMNENLVEEVEARHTELVDLLDDGNYDEAMEYFTQDILYMMHMEGDIQGRDALGEYLKNRAPTGSHVLTQSIVDTEIIGENIAEMYHKIADNVDKEKPLALYREFAIWKRIGGEWFLDSVIINTRPLSDE